jgi:hypothetical protein
MITAWCRFLRLESDVVSGGAILVPPFFLSVFSVPAHVFKGGA